MSSRPKEGHELIIATTVDDGDRIETSRHYCTRYGRRAAFRYWASRWPYPLEMDVTGYCVCRLRLRFVGVGVTDGIVHLRAVAADE